MVNDEKIEIKSRLNNLRNLLEKKQLDAVVIIQNINLYYFSNTMQLGVLIVNSGGETFYFIKRDYDRAKQESPLKNIFKINSFREITDYLDLSSKKIGLELDILPYNQYIKFQELFKNASFFDISNDLRKLRMIKSDMEINKMIQAGILLEKTINELRKHIKEGITELDIAIEMEYLARKNGHMGPVRMRSFNQEMYFGHFLSGKNAFLLSYVDSPTSGKGQGNFFPQGASNKKVKYGDILSIDFVFVYEGYMVDQTRIFSLSKPNREIKHIMNVAMELKGMIEHDVKPGVTCDELVNKTNEIVKKNNLENIFMGLGDKKANYIGHGIGLELDELPVISKGIRDRIEVNVTFAFEPKFFLEPYGIVGFENTYVMKEYGPLLLTKFPEDIQIII